MKYKYTFVLFYIISWVLVYSQDATMLDFDYKQFRSYFGDVYSGSEQGLELPRNSFTQYLYITDNPQEKLYAVGVLKNDNGDDLFIIHRTISDLDIEYTSVVVFRNGELLSADTNEIIIENAPDRDGGIFNQFYEIEQQTIKANIFWSECCSSSGYNTPVAVKAVVGFKIDHAGWPVVEAVDTCLFSSRFFDADYLPTLIKQKEKYPTKDKPYKMILNNWTLPVCTFYESAVNLDFFVDADKEKGVLASIDSRGNIIDMYIIGKKNKRNGIEVGFEDALFKHPIVIKTSDGDIRLLPDGRFLL